MLCRALVLSALLFWSASARAQVTSALTDFAYLGVVQNSTGGGGLCDPIKGYCIGASNGIPLSFFATSSSVASLSGRLDAAIAAFDLTQIQISNINTQLTALNDRVSTAFEVATIAASMRDAIPNPGDRFALRINAAAMEGYAAGSVGVGVNLTDSARVSVNYGRGRTQNVVSGGLNFSFH